MPQRKREHTPVPLSPEGSDSGEVTPSRKRRRQVTVYDAVAGRISSNGFIPSQSHASTHHDPPSTITAALPPEDVLFGRRGAPTLSQEEDVYSADRHLTEQQRLPDSDLLKAIHTYASDFYAKTTTNRGAVANESLDETALLALGILLEEMAGYVLGETGDLAFVEGEEEGDDDNTGAKEVKSSDSVDKAGTSIMEGSEHLSEASSDADKMSTIESPKSRSEASSQPGEEWKRKRRKTKHDSSDDG